MEGIIDPFHLFLIRFVLDALKFYLAERTSRAVMVLYKTMSHRKTAFTCGKEHGKSKLQPG